jgi:hypothetical protein
MRGAAGPFSVRKLPPKTRLRALNELTKAACEWGREKRVVSISCAIPPLAATSIHNIHGVNPLIQSGWDDVSTHTRIIDLSRSESELWSAITHDARWQIKTARSAGYSVQKSNWMEMLDEYYLTHQQTCSRTGASPQPRQYFELIVETASRGQAVLWVGRDRTGRSVAFHNCARYSNGSIYNTGCCKTEHLRSGINYLLFWQAIIGAKEDGCSWYEVGEVFPNQNEGKLHGLSVFKEKFDGELYRYYRGKIELLRWPPGYARLAALVLPRSIKSALKRTMARAP